MSCSFANKYCGLKSDQYCFLRNWVEEQIETCDDIMTEDSMDKIELYQECLCIINSYPDVEVESMGNNMIAMKIASHMLSTPFSFNETQLYKIAIQRLSESRSWMRYLSVELDRSPEVPSASPTDASPFNTFQ